MGQCILALAGYSHACLFIYVSGVNYYLNSNHTKYLAQTLWPISYVLEKLHCKFADLLAPSIDGTTKRLVRCKVRTVL